MVCFKKKRKINQKNIKNLICMLLGMKLTEENILSWKERSMVSVNSDRLRRERTEN
jgi:hypothetical protein